MLKEAWKPVLDIGFEHIGSEINPQFANIVSPSEVVVVTNFRIEMETGGGDFGLCLPYSMLEPIRDLLDAGVQSDRGDRDERWEQALREEILNAQVELSSELTSVRLPMKELARLKAGDIIPLDLPDLVDVFASGVPVFKGELGVSDGNYAVKVQEWRRGSKRPSLHDLLTQPQAKGLASKGGNHERQ